MTNSVELNRGSSSLDHAKCVFVTGGGSGIGRAMATYFAKKGWTVGIGDIDLAGMSETAGLAGRKDISLFHLDVRDVTSWRDALNAFADQNHGRINVVINNAGIGVGGSLVDLADDDIDRMIDVNFRGALIGARVAYPWLLAAGQGSCLLNVASASAIYGAAGLAVYSSTKFAVRGLTEALDLEWEEVGIKCRSLMPAFVDTPMLAQQAEVGSRDRKRDRVVAAGLEFTPVENVAQAAWNAIHGSKLHVLVGKSATHLDLAARWAPSLLRRHLRKLFRARHGAAPARQLTAPKMTATSDVGSARLVEATGGGAP